MRAQIALLITLALIVFLFRRESLKQAGVTRALWIPLLWMLVIIGKNVAEWLQIIAGISIEGAISADSVAWTVLILAGVRILANRRIDVVQVVRSNPWPAAFMLYCLVSVLWSDAPFWSFKHWLATLGHPIMALIILTEPDPLGALKWVMKRSAYVVIPVSILLIKYYPQYGRVFSSWDGASQRAGFAHEKNSLGVICMICGLFFVWHLCNTLRLHSGRAKRKELLLCLVFLFMVVYLFKGLHCGTALVSFTVGVMTLIFTQTPFVNKQFIGTYFLLGMVLLLAANLVFGLKEKLLDTLNKDPTMTNRTVMWAELLEVKINPVLGTGYDSFWKGDLKQDLWDEYWWRPNEAHNGYLETYMNLGLVGVFLLGGCIFATFQKCRCELLRNFRMGLLRLAFLATTVPYNWAEAGFKNLNPVFFIFFIISIDYPRRPSAAHCEAARRQSATRPGVSVSAQPC